MVHSSDLRHMRTRDRLRAWVDTSYPGNGWLDRLKPPGLICGRIGLLLVVYYVLDAWLAATCRLDEAAYGQPVITLGLIERLLAQPVMLAVAAGLGVWRRGLLCRPWPSLDMGGPVRVFVVAVAFMLAWQFSTYDYNFYLDRSHLGDRLLLLALVPLIGWRPIFVLPFLLLCIAVLWQFDLPLGWGYSLSVHKPLIHLLVLFAAAFLLRVLDRGRGTDDFVFLACCLVAANYWLPGLGKLALGWGTHGHLYFMVLAAYAHGWLAAWEPQTVVAAAQALSWFDWPMRLATLVVEVGALLFLWRRPTAKILLVGWTLFHIGVFATFGYCFWEWIGVNVGLYICFFARGRDRLLPVFTPTHFVLSLLVIGGASLWFKPARLAWYDTRIAYTYRFEAIGGQGGRYELPPLSFSPFLDVFAFGTFRYLGPTSQLVGSYGATSDRPLAEALVQSTTPEQIWALEAGRVQPSFNARLAGVLDDFVRRRVTRLDQSRPVVLSWFKPPPVFWTQAHSAVYEGQERIERVEIYRVTSLYDGQRYAEIRREKVRSIAIVAKL
jgi:hypothetical protein